jgi:hypothetical protein
MNGDTGGNRGARRAGLLAVTTATAMLAAACSGSAPPPAGSISGGSARYEQALVYSQCVRSHGVPDFPDPDAAGNIIQQVRPGQPSGNTPQEQRAEDTCQHLLPHGGAASSAVQRRRLSQLLKAARCMRAHGAPNFPDPTMHGASASGDTVSLPGNITLNLGSAGIDVKSPQFQAAQRACRSLLPAGLFSPARPA